MVLIALIACGTGPFEAPPGSAVAAGTEGFTFTWNPDLYFEDGLGYVYADSAYVEGTDQFGRATALSSIVVDITSHWPGAYLLPDSAVKTVTDFTSECADGTITDDGDAQICEGFLAASAGGDVYYEISGEYALADASDGDLSFRPNFLRGVTDTRGLVEFFLFFDSVPGPDSEFSIEYDIGVDTSSEVVSTLAVESE